MINNAFRFGNLQEDKDPNISHENDSNNDEVLNERINKASTKFYELINNRNEALL